MIPEREREALMRLTMCARIECDICIYRNSSLDECEERITTNMNILADALRKTSPNCSEKPNNCEVECENCKHFREEVDTYMKQCEFYFMECHYEPKTEPQTDGYMTAEQTEDYRKMLDKAVYDKWGNVFDARADIEDEPQTDCKNCNNHDRCVYQPKDEPQTERSSE